MYIERFHFAIGLWRDMPTVVKYRRMCVHVLPNQQNCSRIDVALPWLGHACDGTNLLHLADEQAFHQRRLILGGEKRPFESRGESDTQLINDIGQ